MRKLLALAVITSTATVGSATAAPSLDDLLGRWCGDTSRYVFTRRELDVTLLSGQKPLHGPVLKILKVEVKGDEIEVYWQPDKPGNSTGFKLSPDKKQLIQQSQTEGDKGPKRVFKRC